MGGTLGALLLFMVHLVPLGVRRSSVIQVDRSVFVDRVLGSHAPSQESPFQLGKKLT